MSSSVMFVASSTAPASASDFWYSGPVSDVLTYEVPPTWISSPLTPISAGAENVALAFLFSTSTSSWAVVLSSGNAAVEPVPIASTLTDPLTATSARKLLTSWSVWTDWARMSTGSVRAGAAGAPPLHAATTAMTDAASVRRSERWRDMNTPRWVARGSPVRRPDGAGPRHRVAARAATVKRRPLRAVSL